MDDHQLDLAALATQLTALAVKNTAGAISTRVAAIRAGRKHEEQFNELIDIINELVADRSELVMVAKGFQQEVAAQTISADDIQYITSTVIPAVETLTADSQDESTAASVEALKSLVTVESLTVLQLVGFNYRMAIGEPLTDVLRSYILSLQHKSHRTGQRSGKK